MSVIRTILYQTGRHYSAQRQRLVIGFHAPLVYFRDLDRNLAGFVWIPGSETEFGELSKYEVCRHVMQSYDGANWMRCSLSYEENPKQVSELTKEDLSQLRAEVMKLAGDQDVLNLFQTLKDGEIFETVKPAPRRHTPLTVIHVIPTDVPPRLTAQDKESGRVIHHHLSQVEPIGVQELMFHLALKLASDLKPGQNLTYLGTATDNYEGSTLFIFRV